MTVLEKETIKKDNINFNMPTSVYIALIIAVLGIVLLISYYGYQKKDKFIEEKPTQYTETSYDNSSDIVFDSTMTKENMAKLFDVPTSSITDAFYEKMLYNKATSEEMYEVLGKKAEPLVKFKSDFGVIVNPDHQEFKKDEENHAEIIVTNNTQDYRILLVEQKLNLNDPIPQSQTVNFWPGDSVKVIFHNTPEKMSHVDNIQAVYTIQDITNNRYNIKFN